jgi:hypothetical protein
VSHLFCHVSVAEQAPTLLLVATSVAWTAWVPRPIAYLMGLSGLTYLVQGWVASSEGFSPMQSVTIVLAWVLSLVWMIWLVGEGGGLPGRA